MKINKYKSIQRFLLKAAAGGCTNKISIEFKDNKVIYWFISFDEKIIYELKNPLIS